MNFSKILFFIHFPNLGYIENVKNKMPKRKVYTISQIVDAFYSGVSAEKIGKMVKTLAPKNKSSSKKLKG